MLALAVALALVPTPIGLGPRYHPRPALHGPCAAAPLRTGARVHVELFAHGHVVIVPARIGLRGTRTALGRVVSARCRARAWTLDPTGVVHVGGPATLGTLFEVWGRALAPGRLLDFHGSVRLYVGGRRRRGDPRALRLRDGAQIVLEVGTYVPPHARYRFPRRH